MDFKDQIKAKYHQEVQPVFTENNWNAFLMYKSKRKPRRRFVIWFFGIAISIVASVFLFHQINSLDSFRSKEYLAEDPKQMVDLETEIAETTHVIAQEGSDRAIDNQQLNRQLASRQKPPKSSRGTLLHARLDPQQPSDLPASTTPQFKSDVLDKDARKIVDQMAPLKNRESLVQSMARWDLEVSPIEITRSEVPLWRSSRFRVSIYGGLAFPFHVKTIEEQAHQFGGKLYHNLGHRWRSKFGLEFATISFISKVMDPDLGVAIVEAPTELVQFRSAVVESLNMNVEVGIDFLLFEKDAWQGYLGVSYGLSSELHKEIEYEFDEDDDITTDDDVKLAITNPEKYFVPHLLRFESGLQYQTKLGGFNLSLGYPYQLSTKKKIEILGQLQLNLGFTKRF